MPRGRDPVQNPTDEVAVLDPVGGGTLDQAYVYDEVTAA
jgi:hypothetical protein